MVTSTQVDSKKRGRPIGRVFTQVLPVRLTPETVAALDALVQATPEPKPSRAEAIRTILDRHLKAKGYLPR